MDNNVSTKVKNVNDVIAALTNRIRKGLSGIDKEYFDIQEKMDTIQKVSKIQGQTHLNDLSDFLNQRIDQISNSIKEASLASLKANKERLENLKGIAADTLSDTEQGKGIYAQYALIAKKLNQEITSRKQLTYRLGDFLKKNGIDTISIVTALTTRNPLLGLGIKYVLERRKAAKEHETEQKNLHTKDSLAYRSLLEAQKEKLLKPKFDNQGRQLDENGLPETIRPGQNPIKIRKPKKARKIVNEQEVTEPTLPKTEPVHRKKKKNNVVAPEVFTQKQNTPQIIEPDENGEVPLSTPNNAIPIVKRKTTYEGQHEFLQRMEGANALKLHKQEQKGFDGGTPLYLNNKLNPNARGLDILNIGKLANRIKNVIDMPNPKKDIGQHIVDVLNKREVRIGKIADRILNVIDREKIKEENIKNAADRIKAVIDKKDKPEVLVKEVKEIPKVIKNTIHEIIEALEKFHNQDHAFDERKSETEDEARRENEKVLGQMVEDTLAMQRAKGAPQIVARGGNHEITKGIFERVAGNKISKMLGMGGVGKQAEKSILKSSPSMLKNLFGLGKSGAAAEGIAEGAGEGGTLALESAGSILSKISGPILALAVDSILGIFKSEDWKTSKVSSGLGAMMAGTFENPIINTFAQIGKWAFIGAAAGSFFPGVGNIAGGLLGAAFGGIMGMIGGENIAHFLDNTGLGSFLKTNLELISKLIVKPFKDLWRGIRIIGVTLKALTPIFKLLEPVLKPLESLVEQFFSPFIALSTLLNKLIGNDDESVDKALDQLESNNILEKMIASFTKGLLDFAAGMLEKIPGWLPGGDLLHAAAAGFRKKGDEIAKDAGLEIKEPTKTTTPEKEAKTETVISSPIEKAKDLAIKGIGSVASAVTYNPFLSDNKTKPPETPSPVNTQQTTAPVTNTTSKPPEPVNKTNSGNKYFDGFVSSGDSKLDEMMKAVANIEKNNPKYNNPGAIWDPVASAKKRKELIASGKAAGMTEKELEAAAFTLKTYPTKEDGWKALAHLLKSRLNNPKTSLYDIFKSYAPEGHGNNNPKLYAEMVGKKIGINPSEPASTQMKNTEMASIVSPASPVLGLKNQTTAENNAKLTINTPPPAVMTQKTPNQGASIMNTMKQNNDTKAQMADKNVSGNVYAPTTKTSVNNTAVLQQQTNPRNTDTTFRDIRYKTGYST